VADLARESSSTAHRGQKDLMDIGTVARLLSAKLLSAETAAAEVARLLQETGTVEIKEDHLVQQLLQPRCSRGHIKGKGQGLPPPLARGAAFIVAARLEATQKPAVAKTAPEPAVVEALWPSAQTERLSSEEAIDRWGFKDTRFKAFWVDGRPAVQVTSSRYAAVGTRPLLRLWELFRLELGVSLRVDDALKESPLPSLPPPATGLLEKLWEVIPKARVYADADSRLRAGTGHGLSDIWRLRTRKVLRMPDAVVRPENEDEVLALLKAGSVLKGFAVVPVGGRTNVTSALSLPTREEDPRPFVALDTRGLASVQWVNAEDGVACVEAGITGTALQESLRRHGVNMGMEPDSMEFSTLGGWIATRASGMKRSRYGNIEDMIVEVRVATPTGMLWQHHGLSDARRGHPRTGYGRASTNVHLPGLVLGSEGCLGIVTAAVIRIHPLPEVVRYDSVLFPSWDSGAAWMREVARLPAALRPASCRLMDNKQLRLAQAVKEGSQSEGQLKSTIKAAAIWAQGISMEEASAVTLVFEGSKAEVDVQRRALGDLVRKSGGLWGGASSGEAGYALTFAIAYLRDFGLDHHILSESLETMAPWSAVSRVWPAVVSAVESEYGLLRLPGRPYLSCRMTQLYDEGAVLYMYLAVCTAGLPPEQALKVFERLEHAARQAAMRAGGCLSHHHGVGKLRAALLPKTQAPAVQKALEGLQAALDPEGVLGARNGPWAVPPRHDEEPECAPSESLESDNLEEDANLDRSRDLLDVDAMFAAAQELVKSQMSLPNDDKLRFYAHFKQATSGCALGKRPGLLNPVARAKWDAWAALGMMGQDAAKLEYCRLAEKL